MYSDPLTKYLPHSLSRFHILSHIRGTDERGSVCVSGLAVAGHDVNSSEVALHTGHFTSCETV